MRGKRRLTGKGVLKVSGMDRDSVGGYTQRN